MFGFEAIDVCRGLIEFGGGGLDVFKVFEILRSRGSADDFGSDQIESRKAKDVKRTKGADGFAPIIPPEWQCPLVEGGVVIEPCGGELERLGDLLCRGLDGWPLIAWF